MVGVQEGNKTGTALTYHQHLYSDREIALPSCAKLTPSMRSALLVGLQVPGDKVSRPFLQSCFHMYVPSDNQ